MRYVDWLLAGSGWNFQFGFPDLKLRHPRCVCNNKLRIISSTTVINTPRSNTPDACSTDLRNTKGPRTSPCSHMRPLGWYCTNLTTHACQTRANHHLSPPPPSANSGGPTEPKDDKHRLGHYILTTRTHIPVFSHIYSDTSANE